MSDDRISESPTPPRCPVCATGFTTSPGTSCPTCGRVFAPISPVATLPSKTERFRLDGPVWILIGVVLTVGIFYIAIEIPGILIPLGILTIPAIIRTVRLSRGQTYDPALMILGPFVAALGVSILIGVAAAAALYTVCLATVSFGTELSRIGAGLALGLITALIVFVKLSIASWPRVDTSSKRTPSDD